MMRFIRPILAVIFVGVIIWIIYPKLASTFQDIPLLFREADKLLVLLVLGFQVFAYVGDGWLSKILLEVGGFSIKLKDTVKVAILGVVGSQMIPVFGGTAMTYYFYRKFGVPTATAVFLIITWTIFVWSVYLLSLLLSLFIIPKSYFYLLSPRNNLILTAVLIVISYLLLRRRGKYLILLGTFFIETINKVTSFFSSKFRISAEKIKLFVNTFFDNLKRVSQHKIKIIEASLATLFFYTGNLASLYFSFLVFGFHPNLGLLIASYVISWILAVLIFVPETPGVIEASLVAVFVAFGFPAHVSLLATLLFRLFSYWLPLPLGIFSYWRLKREFVVK